MNKYKKTESILPRATRQPGLIQGLLLMIGSCLPILGAVLIAPLLPQIRAHFSEAPLAELWVPLILTMPALMIGLLGPFAGIAIDRFGRKTLLVWALLGYGVFGTAPLWLDNLYGILLSRLGLGVTEALIITCCTTLIGDYYTEGARVRMLALQTMVGSLSAALFFMIGGALGEFGWRTPFWLYLSGFFIAFWVAAALWEPTRQCGAPTSSVTADTPFPWHSHAWVYALTWCGGVSLFIVAVQLGFLLADMGVHSPQMIGMAIGVSHLAVLIGAICSRWSGRFGPAPVLCLAFVLGGVSLVLLTGASSYWQAVVAVIFNGLGAGLMIPTLAIWALSTLPLAQRGRGTGAFMASFYLGQFMSPLVVAIIASAAGGLTGAVRLLGVALMLIALLCAYRSVSQRKVKPVET